MTSDDRRETQEAFAAEKVDIVVATVAFGMGIDRSNVRFVVHAAMPKSVEHYQQETGRAGRDGLPSECVLLYSAGDIIVFRKIIEKSAEEAGASPEYIKASLRHLEDMARYCRGTVCRHRALVEYFGQRVRSRELRGLRSVSRRHQRDPRRHDHRPEDPVVRGPRQGGLRHQPRHRRAPRREHRGHSVARPREALDPRPPEGSAEGRSARLGLSATRSGRAGAGRGRIPGPEAERGVVGSDEGPAFGATHPPGTGKPDRHWHTPAEGTARGGRPHALRGTPPAPARGGGPRRDSAVSGLSRQCARGAGPRTADDRGSTAARFGRGRLQVAIIRPHLP